MRNRANVNDPLWAHSTTIALTKYNGKAGLSWFQLETVDGSNEKVNTKIFQRKNNNKGNSSNIKLMLYLLNRNSI